MIQIDRKYTIYKEGAHMRIDTSWACFGNRLWRMSGSMTFPFCLQRRAPLSEVIFCFCEKLAQERAFRVPFFGKMIGYTLFWWHHQITFTLSMASGEGGRYNSFWRCPQLPLGKTVTNASSRGGFPSTLFRQHGRGRGGMYPVMAMCPPTIPFYETVPFDTNISPRKIFPSTLFWQC